MALNSLESFLQQNRANVLLELESENAANLNEQVPTLPAAVVTPQEGQPEPIKFVDLTDGVEVPENAKGVNQPTIRQFQEQANPDAPKHFDFPDYIKWKYQKGKTPFIKAAYAKAFMEGRISQSEMLFKGNRDYLKHLEEIGALEDVTFGDHPVAFFLGEAAQLIPFMMSTAMESAKWALLGGSIGAVASLLQGGLTAPAFAAAGISAGGTYGVIKNSLDVEGMNILFDLLEDGVSKEAAIPIALAGGIAIGVVELFQLRLFGAGFKKVVVKAMSEKLTKNALANGAAVWLKSTGIQMTQEAIQSSIEISVKAFAALIEKNPNAMMTRGEMVKEFYGLLRASAGMFVLGGASGAAATVQTRTMNQQDALLLAAENLKTTEEKREITIIDEDSGETVNVPLIESVAEELSQEQKLKRGVREAQQAHGIDIEKLSQVLDKESAKKQKIGTKEVGKQDPIEMEDTLPDGGTLKLTRKDLVGRVNRLTELITGSTDKKGEKVVGINERLDKILTEVSKTKDKNAVKRLHNETLKLIEQRDEIQKQIVALSAVENRAARQLGVKKVLLPAKEVVALEEGVIKAKMEGIIRGIKRGEKIASKRIKDVQQAYAGFIVRQEVDTKSKIAAMRDILNVQTQEQFNKVAKKNLKRLRQATQRLQKRAAINSLKKLTKPRKLAKVSSEFLPNIKAILKPFSLTKPTKETTAKLKWLAEELREKANNQMTSDQLRLLEKLDKKPISDLSLEEVEQIHDSVAHLLKLNTEKQQVNEANRTAIQEENLTQAVKNINERFEADDGAITGLDDQQVQVETEIFKFAPSAIKDLLGVVSWNTELIAEILDGMDDGIIMKVMYNAIDDGAGIAINYRTDASKFFEDNGMRDVIKKSWSQGFNRFKRQVNQTNVKLDNYKAPLKMSSGRKISLILLARNENSKRHLMEGGFNWDISKDVSVIKLTEADMDRIIDSASAAELKVADTIQQFFNTMQKDRINEVTEELLGYSIAIEENYFPINVARKALLQEIDTVGLSKDDLFIKRTLEGLGIWQKRVGSSEPLVVSDAMDVVTNQVRSVSNFIGFAKPLRDAKALLHAPEFRAAVTNAGKPKYLASLEDYLDKIEGSLFNNDKIGKLAQHWQSRIDVSVLAGNIGVWFKQPVSYMLAATEINSKYLVGSYRPPFMASNRLIELMKKYSPQARERFEGNITLETGDIAGTGASYKFWLGKQSLSNKAMFMIHQFDKSAIASVWRAVEKETKAEHKGLKVGSDEYYQHVAKRWWKVVRRTQPTFDMKDRSYGGRNTNTLWRLLTKYSSQRNKNWMIQRRLVERFNRSEQGMSDYRKMITGTLLVRVVTTGMIAGINILRSMGKEEEPRKKELSFMQRFIFDWIRTSFGDVFIISPMISALIEKYEKKGKGFGLQDPLTRNFEAMIDWTYQFIDIVGGAMIGSNTIKGRKRTRRDQSKFMERFYRNSMDVISKISGIPIKGSIDTLKLPLQATGLAEKTSDRRKAKQRNY